jgi:hypothetical protein
MKKILFAAGILLMPAIAVLAEDRDRGYANDADPVIEGQFRTDFPNATNLHFARAKGLTVVSFTQDNETMNAYYDSRDQLLGTIHKQSFADLPDNAQKEIQDKYHGFSAANVVKFDDSESEHHEMILYGVSLDDAENFFVELKNDSKTMVVKVSLTGDVEQVD